MKKMRKIVVFMTTILMMCMLASGVTAENKAKVKFMNGTTFTVAPTESKNVTEAHLWFLELDQDDDAYWESDDTDIVIKNVKSSNTKVAKAHVYGNEGTIWIDYRNVTGKTKISFTANGQKISKWFEVKYTSPVATFKVGSTDALKVFKKKNTYVSSKAVKNKTCKIKAKSGWVIDKVRTECSSKVFASKAKTYKVGKASWSKKVSMVTPYNEIQATFRNKKSGAIQTCTFKIGMLPGFSHQAG